MSEPKWEEIEEIVLDKTPVFYHYIEVRDKKGQLLDKIKLPPDKSWDIFCKLEKEWSKRKWNSETIKKEP